MNIQSKVLIIVAAIILIILITYYFVFPVMIKKIWKTTHKDIKDITIEGYVYDMNKNSLDNYTIYITNYYYEGGDGDSFMGGEITPVLTDEKGHYSIKLDKSCNIQIDNVDEGYSKSLVVQDITKAENKIDFYLK